MSSGFFSQYEDTGGLNFVGELERNQLIADKTRLRVLRVTPKGTDQFGPRYIVIVDLDGEERAIRFGAEVVESRDRMLDAMVEYLDQEGDVDAPNVVIYRVGRSQLLRDADAVDAA